MKKTKELRSIWIELSSRYTGVDRVINETWIEIEQNYSMTGRHYHNLNHLKYMMNRLIQYTDRIVDPDTLKFSIFYHDIVYYPNRSNNVEESGLIALDRLNLLGVPEAKIIKCKSQILATNDHKLCMDNDTNYLIDLDLAILGETPKIYNNYTKMIREEYSIYPSFIFKNKRKKILQYFLDMDQIFKTPPIYPIYEKYELQARKNIIAELEEL